MPTVRRTAIFGQWLGQLGDGRAKAKIALRIDRLALGNPGDVKPIGGGLSEMRIDYGPGYRIYFGRRGEQLIILLCGGSKKSQRADIATAKQLFSDWIKTNDQDGSL
ncbi:MAG: addiction module killer protein [Tardiphaga sp.]|jgi:putative addiction module killer protein|nr:addiction module killer protein [Tardiphaga sp.]MDB5627175.1 addiction module killer protein [Tardiphaga sp.]